MYRLNNIKQNILIVVIATLLAGTSIAQARTKPTVTEPVPTEPIVTVIEGLVIADSEEKAVNGDFNTDTVWNKDTGWTIENGTANVDSTGLGNEWLTQPGILTIGKTYTITFTVSNYTSGSIGTDSWYPTYTDSAYVSSDGLHTIDFTAAQTDFALKATSDTILSIDNVSVKESSGAEADISNTEPTVTEPIVTEPVPTEPIVTEPVPTEPTVTEPIVTEPIVTEPILTEPVPTEPTVTVIEGLVIADSEEKAVNGDFNTDTVWDKDTGWTIENGTANVDSTGLGNEWLTQPGILTIGKTYTITFTVSNYTSGSIGTDSWYPTYTDSAYVSSDGLHTIDFTAAQTDFALKATSDTILSIDNVSVKESSGAEADIANTEPTVTEPVPTEPTVTEPVPTEPTVTEPIVTEPIVTEPILTEPVPTEPVPTEPTVTVIEGLVIADSEEKAVNGDFNTDTVWDKDTGWTIENGTANVDSTGLGNEWLTQPGILTIGKTYTITFTVSNYTSGSIGTDSWYPTYTDSAYVSSDGLHTIDFTAAQTDFALKATSDTILSIDNVSVKESSGAEADISNTEPTVTEPIVTEPVPTEPIVTEPVPTEPIVIEPVPTEPIVTEPAPTEPILTEPAPTEPIVTEPVVAMCVEGDATIEGQVITASAENTAVNGDFNTDTVWDKHTGWTIENGTANVDSTGLGNEWLTQPGILTIGKTYTITFTVSNYTSGSIGTDSWYPTYTDSAYVSSDGLHTIDFTAAQTDFALKATSDTILSIDNVSVKESSGAAVSIANVEVTYGACSTLTDTEGYYILPNVITSEKAVINFTHQGYVSNSAISQVKADSTNYIEYEIGAYDHQETYNSQNSIVLNMLNNATVSLPAAVYSDETGNIYNGDVVAEVAYMDVTTEKGREAFPGTYNGQNTNGETVLFASYGVIVVEFKDGNGNSLVLSDGDTAILTFPSIASSQEGNIIPLWYYDYDQGVWIEEGYAELQADGKYEGSVSHTGTWSLNQPIENPPGIYTDRILYPDGTPVKDLRVHAIGENWMSTDLSTDENGIFEIEVIPGKEFALKAYHYTDKYSATYNGMISAVASGDIVDNSEL